MRSVSDQAAVAFMVRMMGDSCSEGHRDIFLGGRDGTVPEKQKTGQEPEGRARFQLGGNSKGKFQFYLLL